MTDRGYRGPLRLVVFDWAGTTVDHGCFAPLAPFVETLGKNGVDISASQARGPMGLPKREHLRALVELPAASAQWQARHGKAPTPADIDRMFEQDFVPLQLACVERHSELIEGLLDTVAWLRERQIKIATTTGYFREAAELCYKAARDQGYVPDATLCGSDVRAGRPSPWMIFRHMETFDIFPPAAVLKIGDTVPDIEEGRNAGTWTVGVSRTGSEVGVTYEEWRTLPLPERRVRQDAAERVLIAAGAHEVIDSIADVPELVARIEERLDGGESP